ncbi:hypothetical protein DLM76_07260 [Leptospira yasudae]|uniref:LA_3696 family protein n=1 Tax=Leptospira yasudae TaxID=2202201 RepID=UPI000E59E2F0|nr:hypothetical protein [Leptospira yasudae]RHX95110.1 hypothetical protein DLM76_07260 [Leptospira yasudae]
MLTELIRKIPRKLEEVLGADGIDQFVDFLNSVFTVSRAQLLESSSERFEHRLTEEMGKQKINFLEFKTGLSGEFLSFKADLKEDFSSFQMEIRQDFVSIQSRIDHQIAEIRAENAAFKEEVRKEIAEFKKEVRQELKEIREEMRRSNETIFRILAENQKAISEMQREISGMHKTIADLHKSIASQARWMFGAVFVLAGFFVVIEKLMHSIP